MVVILSHRTEPARKMGVGNYCVLMVTVNLKLLDLSLNLLDVILCQLLHQFCLNLDVLNLLGEDVIGSWRLI